MHELTSCIDKESQKLGENGVYMKLCNLLNVVIKLNKVHFI